MTTTTESRPTPGIVYFLRIVGALHIIAAVILGITGAITAMDAYTSLKESNSGIIFGLAEASLVFGGFLLAIASMTDKVDSIDYHLRVGRSEERLKQQSRDATASQ